MNYTKYLTWGIIGGLFLALFLPFIVATGQVGQNIFNLLFPVTAFFPYITGKNFVFRILVEIVFGLYVVLALRDARYRPKASWMLWSVGAFVAWMALATLVSVDPVKSFWGNFERMDGYLSLIHLFLFFIVSGAMLSVGKLWQRFFEVSVVASTIQAFYGICQAFHLFGIVPSSQSGNRADGTFGNATYLAVYMLFNLFITLLLMAGVFKNAKKSASYMIPLYGFAFLFQFMALFFTETRGAILGFLGGLIVAALYLAIFARNKEMKPLRYTSFAVLGAIVVLIGGFLALKDTQLVRSSSALNRLASISLEDKTTMSRFIIWNMALKGGMERPIAGWGQENFSYVFNKNYDPAMYSQEQWFDRAHNEFLDWLIAGGVPAMLLYISFFGIMAWVIFRSKTLSTAEQAVLLGLLAAYAFNNLFVFDNLLSLMYFYLLMAFVHGMSKNNLPGWMPLSKPGNDQVVAVAAPIVAVLVVGSIWMLNVPGITRAKTLIDALQSQNPVTGATYTTEDHLATFEKALTMGELGKQETVEQLFQFVSNSVAPSTSVSPETRQKAYTAAENAGKALLAQRKNDARLELFMGVFYSQFGQTTQAIAEFNKSLEHSPNKQQILFQTGVANLQAGNVTEAVALFKKAYDLEPNYPDARILYATGLYYQHEDAAADKLLTDGFGTVLYDDTRLIQTYMSLKMYDRVIAIWNKRVEAAPNDTNTLLGLAGAYFEMGNTTQTIATLRKIIEIDPTSKEQMESIITQLQNGTLKPQ